MRIGVQNRCLFNENCVVPQMRAIINVIVLNGLFFAFRIFSLSLPPSLSLASSLCVFFFHVILAVHSFSTSIELFHTLLLATTLQLSTISTDNENKYEEEKKHSCFVIVIANTSLFSFSSTSFRFHGDLFTVCCFIHPPISFLSLLYVPLNTRRSFTRQLVCLFSSENEQKKKKQAKNINYCYGPLR